MDKKIKHLEMIEGVIERMGNNSFQLKGWTVTLVALVGALAAQGSDKRFFLIAFIPLFAFWFLDSYYLQLERKYEVLYKRVANKEEANIDFNLDINEIEYTEEEMKRIDYWKCVLSKTECTFYLIIAGSVGVVAMVLILT